MKQHQELHFVNLHLDRGVCVGLPILGDVTKPSPPEKTLLIWWGAELKDGGKIQDRHSPLLQNRWAWMTKKVAEQAEYFRVRADKTCNVTHCKLSLACMKYSNTWLNAVEQGRSYTPEGNGCEISEDLVSGIFWILSPVLREPPFSWCAFVLLGSAVLLIHLCCTFSCVFKLLS